MIKTLFFIVVFVGAYGCDAKTKIEDTNLKNDTSEKVESINEQVLIESNGTKLYAEIKGEDKTKPVILFLHGGPGNVIFGLLPFQAYAGRKLEEDFVVVYLHQRGLVNSLPVPDSTQTIENHISDVGNVVDFLTNKFNREKINLIGHSWGGLLGALYLIKDDTKINKFIAIASPFDFEKNNLESFNFTMEWAKSEQNADAINELNGQANAPFDASELQIISKWASQVNGGIAKNISMEKVMEDTGFKEIKQEWQTTSMNVAIAMLDSLNTIKLEDEINKINIPILFIAGANDATVPPASVYEAFSAYQNEKEYLLFENSHHLIFVDELELFTAQVKKFLEK